ncbi:MAG: type II toxin-antitoxin system HipA family toxin, partial [Lentisphaerae bacterium]|nr:type II toxin-antitoxin system HipA family toxin [Lentisphaerota bacterium]
FSVIASPDGDPVLTPAYDLLCTTLHLPTETPLALDLFADDFETAAFAANGFYTADDFAVLADRLGIVPRRRDRILATFVDEPRWDQLTGLVRRSFLSREAQEAYLAICSDRSRALSIRSP